MRRRKVERFFSNPQKNLVYFFLILVMVFCGLLFSIILSLPNLSELDSYSPSETTTFYDLRKTEIGRIHQEENRVIVPLSKMSPWLTKAVVAVEDERFYQHHGIDFSGIARALVINFLEGGRIKQGGSTITQQAARSIFLSRERTYTRKLSEIILALEMERRFNKDEILEKYLNNVYWGHNAYGAEAAARIYFAKSANDLNLAEASLMAGLIEGPELFSPYRRPKLTKARQKVVISRMVANHLISPAQANEALKVKFEFPKERLFRFSYLGPYFKSYVLTKLRENYEDDVIYNGGLKVFTTMDSRLQAIAEQVVTNFVTNEGKKYNFTQAVLVAIDPRTGYIKALVGGADFEKTKFNRAVQMKRQPGSAFKPIIYSAAMKKGISPDDVYDDEEISFDVPRSVWNPKGLWEPQNFSKKYMGKVTLRTALAFSLNIPTIKILEEVGVQNAINLAHQMGIKSDLEPNLALALGVSEVTPLELTSAFGVLANSGMRVEPTIISKIEDRDGNLLYQNEVKETRVLDENIAAVVVDMMKGVLSRGTGFKGRISRPAAAKTGTTENFKDAWFIGFVPQLVVGVWVGNDNNKPMHGIAEVAVCPRIWKAFMEEALKTEPIASFPEPKGLVKATICLDSGLLAGQFCPPERVMIGTYWKDRVPNHSCDIHTAPIEDHVVPDNEIEQYPLPKYNGE